MCGIIGIINATYASKGEDFISSGLITGTIRGMDSVGVMQQAANGSIDVHKLAVPGFYFRDSKRGAELVKASNVSRATFAHHRAATQGAVTPMNAHPFTIRRNDGSVLVGLHNGSLTGWKARPNAKDFEVDSHWAMSRIADVGDEAFKEIEGPYAMVWFDTNHKNKVFAARNSQRPLHAVFSKDKRQVYFASEAGMLAWLVTREGVDTGDEIMELIPGKTYVFDSSGATVTVTSYDTQKPVPKTVTYTYTPVTPKAGEDFVGRLRQAVESGASSKVVPIRAKVAEDLAAAITDALETGTEQRKDDAPWQEEDYDSVPDSWVSTDYASEEEKQAAINGKVYRELNWFEGVLWDEDSGDLYGDMYIYEPGRGKVLYTAVMSGVSQARAHSEYIDNKALDGRTSGGWAVITGVKDPHSNNAVLVVSELTSHGKQSYSKITSAG